MPPKSAKQVNSQSEKIILQKFNREFNHVIEQLFMEQEEGSEQKNEENQSEKPSKF